MRLMFVGQSPSRETEGLPPFVGKCGQFLAELMGTTQEQMLLDHDFINVLDHWPGKGLNGDKWPLTEATVAAQKKLESLRGRTVVLLGKNVARAFNKGLWRYLEWYEIRSPKNLADVVVPAVTIVPHPSGVNRYYNNPDNKAIVSKFLQMLAAKE